jgi:hypothetical protein
MSTAFAPRTDTLPEAQRRLWAELGATPTGFTLYGGTAIALRLGHRQSLNPLDALKAIAFHQDPALVGLSERVKADLVQAVQTTDPENLPKLSPIKPWQESA